MKGSGRLALPDVREWSGGPSGCPGVVERVPRMPGSCQEVFPEVQEWLEDLLRCSGVVRRSSRMSRCG